MAIRFLDRLQKVSAKLGMKNGAGTTPPAPGNPGDKGEGTRGNGNVKQDKSEVPDIPNLWGENRGVNLCDYGFGNGYVPAENVLNGNGHVIKPSVEMLGFFAEEKNKNVGASTFLAKKENLNELNKWLGDKAAGNEYVAAIILDTKRKGRWLAVRHPRVNDVTKRFFSHNFVKKEILNPEYVYKAAKNGDYDTTTAFIPMPHEAVVAFQNTPIDELDAARMSEVLGNFSIYFDAKKSQILLADVKRDGDNYRLAGTKRLPHDHKIVRKINARAKRADSWKNFKNNFKDKVNKVAASPYTKLAAADAAATYVLYGMPLSQYVPLIGGKISNLAKYAAMETIQIPKSVPVLGGSEIPTYAASVGAFLLGFYGIKAMKAIGEWAPSKKTEKDEGKAKSGKEDKPAPRGA